MITALRSRAELELDRFALDPYCKLYLPLWKLDGDSFADHSAYGHLCTRYGTGTAPPAHWTPQGWSFDGVDDHVDCGNPSSLNQLPEFTWESWFSLRAYNYFPHIVSKGSKESYVRDTLVITIRTSATTTEASSQSIDQITLATQTHYVATYNDNTDRKFHIFLQGKEVAYAIQDAAVGAITDETAYPLRIADSDALDRPLDGLISLVLIYNRVLTPQEILDHYIIGKEMFG